MMRLPSRFALSAVIAVLLIAALTPVARAAGPSTTARSVPNPKVTGPITGGTLGYPHSSHPYDLASHGYREKEYFIAGSAVSDGVRGPNEASNGERKGSARYVTRILVRRPIAGKDFNGTAFVEWPSASRGEDVLFEWGWMHPMLMREGYVYVSVSAQGSYRAALSAGPAEVSRDVPGTGLKSWDPERYKPISHPGDEFARDIFSQAVQAIRHPRGIDPMGGLRPEYVLAGGISQSADRLGSYIEKDQAADGLVDGFLIDDDQRGNGVSTTPGYLLALAGRGAPIPMTAFENPGATKILHLRTEAFPTGGLPTTAPNYRRWEVAGSSHTDYWAFTWESHGAPPQKGSVNDEAQAHEESGTYGERESSTCLVGDGNQFPRRYANQAAIASLNTWVRTRVPAPSAPPIEAVTLPGGQATWVRDGNGNVVGGLRLPPMDVPVATYLGAACGDTLTGGSNVHMDSARLAQLYPSHKDYIQRMQRATDAAVAKAWLLPDDATDLMRRAKRSSIGATPVPPATS